MASDWEPADTVSGESLRDFLDAALAAEEQQTPPDADPAVQEVLSRAYTRSSDGWAAVIVTDNYGRDYELAAPCYEDLEDSVKRFLRC